MRLKIRRIAHIFIRGAGTCRASGRLRFIGQFARERATRRGWRSVLILIA